MSATDLVAKKLRVTPDYILNQSRDRVGHFLSKCLHGHSSARQIAIVTSAINLDRDHDCPEVRFRVDEFVADKRRDQGLTREIKKAERTYIRLLRNCNHANLEDQIRLRMKLGACAEMRGEFALASMYYGAAASIGTFEKGLSELSAYSKLRLSLIAAKQGTSLERAKEVLESCKPLLDMETVHKSDKTAMQKALEAHLILGNEEDAIDLLIEGRHDDKMLDLRSKIAECKFLMYWEEYEDVVTLALKAADAAKQAGLYHKQRQFTEISREVAQRL